LSNSIQELTKFQYQTLESAANNGSAVAVIEAPPDASQTRKDEAAGHLLGMEALIPAGLLTDVSDTPEYAESIRKTRDKEGYSYRLFRLTDQATELFRTRLNRGIN
jgi:hypothetical protein